MGGQGRRGTLRVLVCALLLGALAGASPAAAANVIAVGDVQVTESGATVNATFTLTRAAGAFSPSTTVAYQTVDGTAGSPSDYAAACGTRTFASTLLSGATQTQQVTIAVHGDVLDEPDEAFRLEISGAEVTDGDATATIVDDDAAPALAVADSAPQAEGASGAHAAFVVRLSAVSGRDVSVAYSTADASATAGQDYTARTGTLVIAAGSTRTALNVALLDDGVDEPAETFELRLSSPLSATVGDGVATATILDDDEPPPPPPPANPKPSPGAGGSQPQTASPSTSLPVIGAAGPTTGSAATSPSLGLSSPRLKRPSTVLVIVSCPTSAGGCSGRVTIFSVPSPRSRIKALRKERKLGRLTFTLEGGRSQRLSLRLGRSDLGLLERVGRMRVRAYALTQDAAGRTGVRSVTGTLIARTGHTSPSR